MKLDLLQAPFRPMRLAVIAACLSAGVAASSAQGACATVSYYDSVDRLCGNVVGRVRGELAFGCVKGSVAAWNHRLGVQSGPRASEQRG